MAVNDIHKVRVVTYNGTLIAAHLGINVMHWQVVSETGLGVSEQELATVFDADWANSYAALISANAQYRGTGAQRIWPILGLEAVETANKQAGGVAGDLLSAQCGFLEKFSALGGRQNKGRMYVPFPSEADNTAANEPSAGYIVNLAALAVAIGTSQVVVGVGGTATLRQVIYHRTTHTGTDVTLLAFDTQWATQRRRMPRGKLRPVPF